MTARIPAGVHRQAQLVSVDPGELRAVRGTFDPEILTVQPAAGGWTSIQRPRRSPLTEFEGSPELRCEFEWLFDRRHNPGNISIEPELQQLEILAKPTGPGKTPPIVRLDWPNWHHKNRRWVIQELVEQSDPFPERDGNGNRTRQAVRVVLLEHVFPEIVVRPPSDPPEDPADEPERSERVHVIQGEQNLYLLAILYLGQQSRWTEIAELNDLDGPDNPEHVEAGDEVRIPPR